MTEDITVKSDARSCLYEIVGVPKSSTAEELKKAYRVRALQCHPDKDPSPEAKLNFQKLSLAYNILRDPESRRLYDETGYIEGEGFDKAADFFRSKFGRISEQDIVAFEEKYKNSAEEIADVREHYMNNSGDVSRLLEWVPLSEPGEVDRFLEMLDNLISAGELESLPKYKPSIGKLRKNAGKMKKEQSKFSQEEEVSLASLALSIQKRRSEASESFFDDLIAKYSKKPEKKKSRVKN